MQLKSFKTFIKETIREGNRLQKVDINAQVLTNRRFTSVQMISLCAAVAFLFVAKRGFSDNFAGFIISFLGIFIGLFTTVVISLYDKGKPIFEKQIEKEEKEQCEDHGLNKAKLIQFKNYLTQFTGLTSYSILIAIVIILLLSLVLLDDRAKMNLFSFPIASSWKAIDYVGIIRAVKTCLLVLHRFFTVYFLVNFFAITIYSITSYFSFISSEYKRLKLK